MSNQLIAVPFYEENLVLVNQDDEAFVAMKPIVTNLGLDWKAQHTKLSEKFSSTMVIITTVGEDGKDREMVCLPLRKIPAFLYSINPNKVKEDLRDKIIRYQNECDDVLNDYWTKGYAGKPPIQKAISPNQVIAVQRQIKATIKDMRYESDKQVWHLLFEQLSQACALIGIHCPSLEELETIKLVKAGASS